MTWATEQRVSIGNGGGLTSLLTIATGSNSQSREPQAPKPARKPTTPPAAESTISAAPARHKTALESRRGKDAVL